MTDMMKKLGHSYQECGRRIMPQLVVSVVGQTDDEIQAIITRYISYIYTYRHDLVLCMTYDSMYC